MRQIMWLAALAAVVGGAALAAVLVTGGTGGRTVQGQTTPRVIPLETGVEQENVVLGSAEAAVRCSDGQTRSDYVVAAKWAAEWSGQLDEPPGLCGSPAAATSSSPSPLAPARKPT